jgi:tRNA U34 5-methylaminomethyl-2-thiouridine-forming methyltransferase MnmC
MREIVVTKDGSHTIAIPEKGVTYHSVHGAVQESVHVFIEAGLKYVLSQREGQPLAVFEMGFGTGLNAFLTAIYAQEHKAHISYTAVETAPLVVEEVNALNYADTLGHPSLFHQLHASAWDKEVVLTDYFTLEKVQTDLATFSTPKQFDVLYYDAFAPSAQPELWTTEMFAKLFALLRQDGMLVTYCSKGDVRRAMQAAGFLVKKLPGPPGKREMLQAKRP